MHIYMDHNVCVPMWNKICIYTKCMVYLCTAAEVAEGASSSTSNSDIHHLQLVAMPFPGEPADLLVTGHNMQHAKWPLSADSILPPWEADSALSLPGINDVNTSLDVSDSGLSCGKVCCVCSTILSVFVNV